MCSLCLSSYIPFFVILLVVIYGVYRYKGLDIWVNILILLIHGKNMLKFITHGVKSFKLCPSIKGTVCTLKASILLVILFNRRSSSVISDTANDRFPN